MLSYILRRLVTGLVTLFGISVISFFIIQLVPGDPAQIQTSQIADAAVSERVYQQLRELYGLDKPIPVQYANWVGKLVVGDLGSSFHDGRRVSAKIGEALWPTLSVALLSFMLTLIISTPIGIYSALQARAAASIARSAPGSTCSIRCRTTSPACCSSSTSA